MFSLINSPYKEVILHGQPHHQTEFLEGLAPHHGSASIIFAGALDVIFLALPRPCDWSRQWI
jgi:hypothetical protein